MRFSLFVSLLLIFNACAPKPYKHLVAIDAKPSFAPKSMLAKDYQPVFDKVLYNCLVEGRNPLGKKYSLSGLLFFKMMDDSSTRVVFQNQMGITFFDFGWGKDELFTVHQIMPEMDKAALVKTLKKDLEILLYKNIGTKATGLYTDGKGKDYLRFDLLNNGKVYYIFEQGDIVAIENANEKRKVNLIDLTGAKGFNTLSHKIQIQHLRAKFSIHLTQIIQEENENIEDATTD